MTHGHGWSRRRFVVAATLAASAAVAPWRAACATPRWTWRGVAMGARASLVVEHPERAVARSVVERCVDEIRRLERVFSLFDPSSALSRLNRHRVLDQPPPELVEVLALARRVGDASDGAFDVSVQPLWTLYQRHFSRADADPRGPTASAVEATLAHVGYRDIESDTDRVRLGGALRAITLNGIAQGFVTDRVVRVMSEHGLDRVLVDAGEVRAGSGGWRVGVKGASGIEQVIALDRPRAVATSAPTGFVFEPSGRHHHLLDPLRGASANRYASVTVQAPTAALADALSTACASLARERIAALARAFDDVEVLLVDGPVRRI
ncbi:MAG: FAD:protein FMN transferase [Ectothiorhodospiraceae bacterium]|nr:FAD:protein FMN transferase [Chromatiales bacterium]MCP5153613.1 FAD:protein FMN transferase [Ectothiorhodospiraceae bacterium]